MKKRWIENGITMFALKGTEPQRLFNILLGLMGSPDALRGAVRSPNMTGSKWERINAHRFTFAANDDVSNG